MLIWPFLAILIYICKWIYKCKLIYIIFRRDYNLQATEKKTCVAHVFFFNSFFFSLKISISLVTFLQREVEIRIRAS